MKNVTRHFYSVRTKARCRRYNRLALEDLLIYPFTGCSSVWLECLLWKQEATGSSPVTLIGLEIHLIGFCDAPTCVSGNRTNTPPFHGVDCGFEPCTHDNTGTHSRQFVGEPYLVKESSKQSCFLLHHF